jgi:hypothetical protein
VKPPRQTFRASASDLFTDVVNEEITFISNNGQQIKLSFDKSITREVKVRAGVLTDVKPTSTSQLLGVDKLVETAWDLIPFSFIIDWFTNVGDTLSAWTPTYGFNALASWVVVEDITTQKTQLAGVDASYGSYSSWDYRDLGTSISRPSINKVTVLKERIPDYQRPLLPSFDLNLDLLKTLDLAIITRKIRKNHTGLTRYM